MILLEKKFTHTEWNEKVVHYFKLSIENLVGFGLEFGNLELVN